MTRNEAIEKMRDLGAVLTEASRIYYAENREIMSNFEYDRLYDELVSLEKETGIVLAASPTLRVGYEAVTSLPQEAHASPMLSLDKTKDIAALAAFAGPHRSILSWKMDGLTVVLTYRNGELVKGVTRGNGVIGEVVTPNVRAFQNVPLRIPFAGELVLRGEAVIRYSDFERINESLPEGETPYKNPRNLCSGAVRQLDSAVTAKRCVRFYAFSLVTAEGADFANSHEAEFRFLAELGFDVVEYRIVDGTTLPDAVRAFEAAIPHNDFPSDGLVLLYDDIAYGASLGTTAKFPRNAIAFKWEDETKETVLRNVEWNASRTGRINPIAVFDPVELEGTTVTRASVHNVSFVRNLRLGIGDHVTVYKANMIIPQIEKNLTGSGTLPIPQRCPVCGAATEIVADISAGKEKTETLYCTDPDCPARKIYGFDQFVNRNALDVDGLSEQTLEKFIAAGLIRSFADIFRLPEHREEIASMEGFGEKSFENLCRSVEKASHTTLPRLLYGLGIPDVGQATAKLLSDAFEGDLFRIRNASEEELCAIDTIGPKTAASVRGWFDDPKSADALDELLPYLTVEKPEKKGGSLAGKTFVITGSLTHFANRDALVAEIEKRGGKVSSSVSAKTDYLINNNVLSTSGKNKKAKELNIPVIDEETFLAMTESGGA